MKERKAEIILMSILGVCAFMGGIVFALHTPPNVYDLITSFFYGIVAMGAALHVCDAILEAQKSDEEWKQFIDGMPEVEPINVGESVALVNDHVERINTEIHEVFGISKELVSTKILKKKRKTKRKKHGRRKTR